MRNLSETQIKDTIKDMLKEANFCLPFKIKKLLEKSERQETTPNAKKILRIILKNIEIAEKESLPICQDTGIVEVFLKIGSNVNIDLKSFSSFQELIDRGVESAYKEFFLRKSVVTPLKRKNTGTNTPSILWTELVKGEEINISIMVKGFGSENVTQLKMFNPLAKTEDIEDFIVETVEKAGPNPCPPVFLGIGIGGTSDKAVFLSKKALLRAGGPVTEHSKWENKIKEKVNRLGIGVCGLGGKTTCLDVKIETFPTHIAGLPVAVSVSCWAHRMAEKTI